MPLKYFHFEMVFVDMERFNGKDCDEFSVIVFETIILSPNFGSFITEEIRDIYNTSAINI